MISLAICIPTVDREQELRACVQSILSQVLPPNLDLAIYLSDNSSVDNTWEFLSETARMDRRFRAARTHERLPIDDSMLHAIRMAHHDYVFPLGDDDILVDGALTELTRRLLLGPDLLLLRRAGARALAREGEWPAAGSPTTVEAMFGSFWDKMPFGSFIVRREAYSSSAHDSRYGGTRHAYTGLVWDWLCEKEKGGAPVAVRQTKRPIVRLGSSPKTWQPAWEAVFFVDIPAWFDALPGELQPIAQRIKQQYLDRQFSWVRILERRRVGAGSLARLAELGASLDPKYLARVRIMDRIPRWLATMWALPGGVLRRIRVRRASSFRLPKTGRFLARLLSMPSRRHSSRVQPIEGRSRPVST